MNTEKYPSDLIRIITELCFLETTPLKPSDLIIVFGNNCPALTIDILKSIVDEGLFLQDGKIILSGANGSINKDAEKEAICMFKLAISKGMKSDWFVIEDRATNCLENLVFSKNQIEAIGGFEQFHSILFLGMSFMMRRAQMGASSLGYPMEKIQYKGIVNKDGRNIDAKNWWINPESRKRLLEEVERLGKYSAKGDISIF